MSNATIKGHTHRSAIKAARREMQIMVDAAQDKLDRLLENQQQMNGEIKDGYYLAASCMLRMSSMELPYNDDVIDAIVALEQL